MKTHSVLVAFPGYPFTMQTLLPNLRLASLAAALEEDGHSTEICDFGTVTTLDRLFPRDLRAAAQFVADRVAVDPSVGAFTALRALWRLRGMDRSLRKQQTRVAEQAAREIAEKGPLDFVVFDIERAEDLKGTVAVAALLQEVAPSTRLVASGMFVEKYAGAIAGLTDVFDCYCTADADATVVRWAERLVQPEAWALIPNLVYASRGHVHATGAAAGPDLDATPFPAYRSDVYSALAGDEKLKLFGIEAARSRVRGFGHEVFAARNGTEARTKSAQRVCDETAFLMKAHDLRAFEFRGGGVSASHVEAVAYELLSRGLSIWYGRSGAMWEMSPKAFSTLKASGCQALSFQVDSGSQWLLDEYYGHPFGVTQAEHVLRACKFSDIFTVGRFIYPCPGDDYHTRAETVRLIERTRPHGVVLDPIVALPPSPHPKRGLDSPFDGEDLARYALAGRLRVGTDLRPFEQAAYCERTRGVASSLREQESFMQEIASLGACPCSCETAGLVARVSDYAGHERDFGALVRRHLFAGDADRLAAVVERLNHQVPHGFRRGGVPAFCDAVSRGGQLVVHGDRNGRCSEAGYHPYGDTGPR